MDLSTRRLATYFPTAIERRDYALVNLNSYRWRHFPNLTLARASKLAAEVSTGILLQVAASRPPRSARTAP